MNTERSCGGVIFKKDGNAVKYLIIRSLEGIYGFPKGHMESGETEEETAKREIREEVGVSVPCFIDGFRFDDQYMLPAKMAKNTLKKVAYFLAEYPGGDIVYQKSELSAASFMTYEEAIPLFRFDNPKRILEKVRDFLTAKKLV